MKKKHTYEPPGATRRNKLLVSVIMVFSLIVAVSMLVSMPDYKVTAGHFKLEPTAIHDSQASVFAATATVPIGHAAETYARALTYTPAAAAAVDEGPASAIHHALAWNARMAARAIEINRLASDGAANGKANIKDDGKTTVYAVTYGIPEPALAAFAGTAGTMKTSIAALEGIMPAKTGGGHISAHIAAGMSQI